MAGPPKSRGMIQYVFKHFWNSLKVAKRPNQGTLVGSDPYGNQYFELPAQPQLGKRKPSRWYTAQKSTGSLWNAGRRSNETAFDMAAGFDKEIPAEWESWLRHRRAEAPAEEEVLQSMALAQMKKINAAKLEEAREKEMIAAGLDPGPPKPQDHEKTPFPKHEKLEVVPGENEHQERDRWEKYKNPYMKK